MKTIIEDAFDGEVVENYTPHNILYGSEGWIDSLSDATIDVLLGAGAIVLARTVTGVGFETRLYVSAKGWLPVA
jgi:hypothetical protein